MSAMSIFSSLAIMGGATFAAFSSTDTVEGNTFAAGELVLEAKVGGSTSTPAFSVTNASPGDSYSQVIDLANTGTLASTTTTLTDITFPVAPTSAFDLSDVLDLEIWDDVNGNAVIDVGDVLRGSAPLNSPAWTNIDLGFGIAGPGSHLIIAKITVNPGASNAYQGADAGTFSFVFTTTD